MTTQNRKDIRQSCCSIGGCRRILARRDAAADGGRNGVGDHQRRDCPALRRSRIGQAARLHPWLVADRRPVQASAERPQ